MDVQRSNRNFNAELKLVAQSASPELARFLCECYRRYHLDNDTIAVREFYDRLGQEMGVEEHLYPSAVETYTTGARTAVLKDTHFEDGPKMKFRPVNEQDLPVIIVIMSYAAEVPDAKRIFEEYRETLLNRDWEKMRRL